jgi:hypothetical protein
MATTTLRPRAARDIRPSDTAYALIKRIHDAVKTVDIRQPFTVRHVVTWMSENNIRKEDGTKYKEGYVATLLSNSYINKKNITSKNSIWLDRRFNNKDCVYEYRFVD